MVVVGGKGGRDGPKGRSGWPGRWSWAGFSWWVAREVVVGQTGRWVSQEDGGGGEEIKTERIELTLMSYCCLDILSPLAASPLSWFPGSEVWEREKEKNRTTNGAV